MFSATHRNDLEFAYIYRRSLDEGKAFECHRGGEILKKKKLKINLC